MNKYERESIKYLQHKGYKVEPLHRNKRSSHLIILVDEVKISISSTPSDNRGMKNTMRCISIGKKKSKKNKWKSYRKKMKKIL